MNLRIEKMYRPRTDLRQFLTYMFHHLEKIFLSSSPFHQFLILKNTSTKCDLIGNCVPLSIYKFGFNQIGYLLIFNKLPFLQLLLPLLYRNQSYVQEN